MARGFPTQALPTDAQLRPAEHLEPGQGVYDAILLYHPNSGVVTEDVTVTADKWYGHLTGYELGDQVKRTHTETLTDMDFFRFKINNGLFKLATVTHDASETLYLAVGPEGGDQLHNFEVPPDSTKTFRWDQHARNKSLIVGGGAAGAGLGTLAVDTLLG